MNEWRKDSARIIERAASSGKFYILLPSRSFIFLIVYSRMKCVRKNVWRLKQLEIRSEIVYVLQYERVPLSRCAFVQWFSNEINQTENEKTIMVFAATGCQVNFLVFIWTHVSSVYTAICIAIRKSLSHKKMPHTNKLWKLRNRLWCSVHRLCSMASSEAIVGLENALGQFVCQRIICRLRNYACSTFNPWWLNSQWKTFNFQARDKNCTNISSEFTFYAFSVSLFSFCIFHITHYSSPIGSSLPLVPHSLTGSRCHCCVSACASVCVS